MSLLEDSLTTYIDFEEFERRIADDDRAAFDGILRSMQNLEKEITERPVDHRDPTTASDLAAEPGWHESGAAG